MLTREIGTTGIKASAVGLGTWAIGGWMWGGTDENAAVDAIKASIDKGISLIDTAPVYGMGRSEEIVGRAIAGHRDKIVLATKCGLVWHAQKGNHFFDQQDKPVHRYLGKDAIVYEVEQSLSRLGTDYIDLYITHWQDPTTPVAETMAAMEQLKKDGKIRAIGASNTSVEDLNAYLAAGQLDALQEEYSMVKRDIESSLLPVCSDNNVSMLSYSSLSLGLLSGKIGPARKFDGDDLRKDNPLFSTANRQRIARLMNDIAPICEAHSATSAQVIIAWTLQQKGITFSLCGARNPQQANENADAGHLNLSQDDIMKINSAAAEHLTDLDG
ncbi:MAG: aldo/keto reductase [Rhizobiaceae bacterium]